MPTPNPKRKRTTTNREEYWESVFATLRGLVRELSLPSLNELQTTGSDPWQILVATILSLRTRDAVTIATSRALFAIAPTPASLRACPLETITKAIYPSAFFHRKARELLEIASLLKERGDQVPSGYQDLIDLPGVGPKTANLVRALAFSIPALCVDIHVHRIPNRLGWINTKTPEESQQALEALWPETHWIEANALLVRFGQAVCRPVGPRCSICPFRGDCPRLGVAKIRQ